MPMMAPTRNSTTPGEKPHPGVVLGRQGEPGDQPGHHQYEKPGQQHGPDVFPELAPPVFDCGADMDRLAKVW